MQRLTNLFHVLEYNGTSFCDITAVVSDIRNIYFTNEDTLTFQTGRKIFGYICWTGNGAVAG